MSTKKRYHTREKGHDTAEYILQIRRTLSHYGEVILQCRNQLDLTSPQNRGSNCRCGWTDRREFHSCGPLSL